MKFTGTGVAIVTPFKNDRTVDFVALQRIVEHCIPHLDYIVALGTTGETATLNSAEKVDIVRCVVESAGGRVPIVMGIGGNDTAKVVAEVKQANFDGISGLLTQTPYYNKPSQGGLIEHFKAVAAVCPVPVILYNVPGRTGVNMTAETTLRLAREVENIVAIKEASGMMVQLMQIINNRPSDFSVISGDDAITLPLIAVGGQGVISVTANAYPREMSSIVKEALANNFSAAREFQYAMLDLFETLFVDGSPSGIKAMLHILGLCENVLRLPLVPVSEKTYNKLKTVYK